MLAFLMIIFILGVIAYLIRNPDFLLHLIICLLSVAIIVTPFWPFALLGVLGIAKLRRDEHRASQPIKPKRRRRRPRRPRQPFKY